MDKSTIETFVGYLNDADINTYSIRYCDGSQISTHGNDSGYISLQNDAAVVLESKNNYGNKSGSFNIKFIAYDDISYVGSSDLTVKQVQDVISAIGIAITDEIKAFIASRGGRVSITPSDGNVKYDENGNEIIPNFQMPRITVK